MERAVRFASKVCFLERAVLLKTVCLRWVLTAALVLGAGAAAENTETAKPDESGMFKDTRAGYSFLLPEGYRRLSDDEHREAVRSVGEALGKQASERVLRNPPACFIGPVDPKRPKATPPRFSIEYYDSARKFDAALMGEYKAQIEDAQQKSGEKHGDLSLKLVDVGGEKALRVDRETFSVNDNSREFITRVMIPGPSRRYDVEFVCSAGQTDSVEQSLATVLKSFSMQQPVSAGDEASPGWWRRTLAYTIGGFGAGIVLSLLILWLSRVGRKAENTQPGKSGT
jgi:hypothetical protein